MSKDLRDATEIVLVEGIPLIKAHLAKGFEPFGHPMMHSGNVSLMMAYHTPFVELELPTPIAPKLISEKKTRHATKSTV